MKHLIVISFTVMLFMLDVKPAVGNTLATTNMYDGIEQSYISVSVKSSTLRVIGAAGQTLYIYNVTGMLVKSIKIDGSDCRYDVNLPHGCYIVKVGKWVRKISVR